MATSSRPSSPRAPSFSTGAILRLYALAPYFLFLLALLPRLAALRRYVTPDELNWVFRSVGLHQAIASANWADTIQSGHPGITTTWIGAIAIQLQRWLLPASNGDLRWLKEIYWLSPDNAAAYRHLYTFLDGSRLAVALVTSLCIVFIFLLARDLLGGRAALVGTALLALDPFFAGLSGLLHVDALLATFSLLALLLALRTAASARSRDALLTGVATGLALLTKTPGLILLLFIPIILLSAPLLARLRRSESPPPLPVRPLLVWLLALLAITLFLLPALWADPLSVWRTLTGLSGRLIGDPVRPIFFLGKVTLHPGPLFYPLATLLRLSPAVTIGVAVALIAVARALRRQDRPQELVATGWLLLFSLLFLTGISIAAKKFDRYALPALVAFILVAGWGSVRIPARTRVAAAIAPGLVLLQGLYLLLALPYPLTAYNWLAGGATVAQRVLPAGWGEDAGAAARWLTNHINSPENATLFTSDLTGTAPFFAGTVVRRDTSNMSRLRAEDYLLVLSQDAQGNNAISATPPRQTIDVTGTLVARLYQGLVAADFGVPPLRLQPQPYQFDASLRLSSSGFAFLPYPEEALVALQWEAISGAPLSPDYRLQAQLVDDAGAIRTQRELPLLNEADMLPAAWTPGRGQRSYFTLAIPPDLPPDDYELVTRVFDAGGNQLGVFDIEGRFQGVAAALSTVTVAPPAVQPALSIPHRISDALPLLGHGDLPAAPGSGELLTLDLWWQRAPGQEDTLTLHLGDAAPTTSITTEGWRADQGYHIRPRWRLPVTLAPGTYPLTLAAADATGRPLWPEPLLLGTLTVRASERTFTLPAGVEPLALQVGSLAYLQDVSTELADEQMRVHVLWQARTTTDVAYTTFLHLRDAAGAMMAQGDRPPAPATATWVPGQVIVETYELPRPPAGRYTINLGLYDAQSGVRLPLFDAKGNPLAGDQYTTEVAVP